jgi:hypothetical protein
MKYPSLLGNDVQDVMLKANVIMPYLLTLTIVDECHHPTLRPLIALCYESTFASAFGSVLFGWPLSVLKNLR